MTKERTIDSDDRLAWQRRQDASFRVGAKTSIAGSRQAERFVSGVGIALRYSPTKGLPLASLYLAFAGDTPDKAHLTQAITLTNRLLGEAHAIEVHVIADRVSVVHASLVPGAQVLKCNFTATSFFFIRVRFFFTANGMTACRESHLAHLKSHPPILTNIVLTPIIAPSP